MLQDSSLQDDPLGIAVVQASSSHQRQDEILEVWHAAPVLTTPSKVQTILSTKRRDLADTVIHIAAPDACGSPEATMDSARAALAAALRDPSSAGVYRPSGVAVSLRHTPHAVSWISASAGARVLRLIDSPDTPIDPAILDAIGRHVSLALLDVSSLSCSAARAIIAVFSEHRIFLRCLCAPASVLATPLPPLPALEQLSVSGGLPDTSGGVDATLLLPAPRLCDVSVRGAQLSAPVLRWMLVPSMRQRLRRLTFRECSIPSPADVTLLLTSLLPQIAGLTALHLIDIQQADAHFASLIAQDVLPSLRMLQRLTVLSVDMSLRSRIKILRALKHAPNLSHVQLFCAGDGFVGDDDDDALGSALLSLSQRASNVASLGLLSSEATIQDSLALQLATVALPRWRGMRALDMRGWAMAPWHQPPVFDAVLRLPALQVLCLPPGMQHQVQRDLCRLLPGMQQLRVLSLPELTSDLAETLAAALQRLRQLYFLALDLCLLSSQDLAVLAPRLMSLPYLRRVRVAHFHSHPLIWPACIASALFAVMDGCPMDLPSVMAISADPAPSPPPPLPRSTSLGVSAVSTLLEIAASYVLSSNLTVLPGDLPCDITLPVLRRLLAPCVACGAWRVAQRLSGCIAVLAGTTSVLYHARRCSACCRRCPRLPIAPISTLSYS